LACNSAISLLVLSISNTRSTMSAKVSWMVLRSLYACRHTTSRFASLPKSHKFIWTVNIFQDMEESTHNPSKRDLLVRRAVTLTYPTMEREGTTTGATSRPLMSYWIVESGEWWLATGNKIGHLKLHNATFPGHIHPETTDFQFLSRFKELYGSFFFGTEYRQGINHCTSNSASTCSDTGGGERKGPENKLIDKCMHTAKTIMSWVVLPL
jgi:hypothetical protein